MDKLKHKYYTEDMNGYPDKPYELKHVYDTKTDKYVINEEQCCYYSPESKHEFCTHRHKCILYNDKWEYYDERVQDIIIQIKEIRHLINDYENIKQNFINGDIIYHGTLEDYYTISYDYDLEGNIKVNVEVVPNFKNIINVSINNLKLELRILNRELLRVKRRR